MIDPLEGSKYWEEYKRRYRRRLLSDGILAVSLFGTMWFLQRPTVFGIPTGALKLAAFLFFPLYALYRYFQWRCPSCNAYLGRSYYPKFCQKCGIQLHE
jgi:hypothetical protein